MTDRKLIICACLSYEFKLGTSASFASCKLQKMTLAKIAELKWEIMLHLSYSPDLSPTDFYLFLSLDNGPDGRCFHAAWAMSKSVH